VPMNGAFFLLIVVVASYVSKQGVLPVHNGSDVQDVYQIDTCNQFCKHWLDVAEKYNGPSAICGWMSFASAALLEEYTSRLGSSRVTLAQLAEISALLRDPNIVQPHVERAFRETHETRRAFWSSYSKIELNRGMRAWMANYELGDLLAYVSLLHPQLRMFY
jgi:hypothetical protein